MARSFRLDDGGDSDNLLSFVLLVVALALSCVNFWITIPPLTIFPAPIVVFVVTRGAYKWHFGRRIAKLQAASSPSE